VAIWPLPQAERDRTRYHGWPLSVATPPIHLSKNQRAISSFSERVKLARFATAYEVCLPGRGKSNFRMIKMLFIMHNTEDGIRCETIERDAFDQWIKEHTDGIKAESHPRFIDKVPDDSSDPSEYFVVDGRVIHPKPVTVVKSYSLD
jgi:hypothetical protein